MMRRRRVPAGAVFAAVAVVAAATLAAQLLVTSTGRRRLPATVPAGAAAGRLALSPRHTRQAAAASTERATSADRRPALGSPGLRCFDTLGTVRDPRWRHRPQLVVVGASVTAGTGAAHRREAWPYLLVLHLGWRARVEGIPGAGYVRPARGGGTIGAEVASLHLARQPPQLVVLQGGHNDLGVAPAFETAGVEGVIAAVHRQAPQARIAVLTVFRGTASPAAADRTDRTIIAAARRADPAVVVVSPLQLHWHYPTIADHLHPDQAGEVWLASHVGRRLAEAGVVHVAGGSRGADVDVSASCAGGGNA